MSSLLVLLITILTLNPMADKGSPPTTAIERKSLPPIGAKSPEEAAFHFERLRDRLHVINPNAVITGELWELDPEHQTMRIVTLPDLVKPQEKHAN